MKKIIVTGGAGFIGSNLVKRLFSEGHVVDVVDDMSSGKEELLQGCQIRESFPGLLYKEEERSFIRLYKDDFAGSILNCVFICDG